MNSIMKKTIVLLCFTMLSSFSFADAQNCLSDLAGDFQSLTLKGKPESILSIKHNSKDWDFSLPDDIEYNADTPFRYHFNRAKVLKASSITGDGLQYVGYTMLTPSLEKNIKLDNVKVECGLAVDGIFLVRMDLSHADNKLLKNIAILNNAMASKNPDIKIGNQQIKKLQGIQYFAGESLQLDGVINTITPFLVQKSAGAG